MKELCACDGELLLLSHLLLLLLVNLGDEPRGIIVPQYARVGQDFKRPGVPIVPLHITHDCCWNTVAFLLVVPGEDLITRHELELPVFY